MSRVHRDVVFESLEARKHFATVQAVPDDIENAQTQGIAASSSVTISHDAQPFPVLRKDANGVVRIAYNGWNPVSVTKISGHQYSLRFNLSVTAIKKGVIGGIGDSTDLSTLPLTFRAVSDGASIDLTLIIPDTGIRRIVWPRTRATDPEYPSAPTGKTPSDPAPGIYDDTQKGWEKKLKQQLEEANNSKATVAFFGDSHIERYPYYGGKSWAKYFPDALNLGLRGDSTRQLLQRINAGLFDRFKPKTLVMMFGTNNFNDPATGGSDTQIEAGIQAVLAALRQRLPDTKFVLISMLPRNSAERNTRIQHVNSLTADFARKNGITFLDIYDHFVGDPIRRSHYFDKTHLNAVGYRLLSNYLAPLF